ncbi:MAG: hypothetical protein AAGE52_40190 [Myxococcota bacterium]
MGAGRNAPREETWERAERGDVEALLEDAPLEHPAVAAFLALTGVTQPPSPSEIEDSRTRGYASLFAFLSLDEATLGALASVGDARAQRLRAVLSGIPLQPTERRESIDVAIDALAAMANGQPDYLDLARQAVRMARADGYLLREYFTSIVLARARRYHGHPHLATRILRALRQVAPAPWHGWIEYEHFLANPTADATTPWELGRYVRSLVVSAEAGDRTSFAELVPPRIPGLFAEEINDLWRVLGASGTSPSLRPWLDGHDPAAPGSIAGFCVPEISGGSTQSSVMLRVSPSEPTRRVLRCALRLVGGVDEAAHTLTQERTYTLLAELVGASGPLSRADLFQRVYGFGYKPTLHSGTFRVLLHRARAAVEGQAEILDENHQLQLRPTALCFLPDPRCTLDLEGIVLHHLARTDSSISARAIAEALSVSVRSVQKILKELLDIGACEMHRDGRAVEYRLEDTTFHSPTLTRLRLAPPS